MSSTHPSSATGTAGACATASAPASMRLDAALVARGLVATRSKAGRLIKAGNVTVNGRTVTRPAAHVSSADRLTADAGDNYVSRGAWKLVGAFEAFATYGLPEPRGMSCLDIGASTGGFTEVLLRRGAAHVIALDVGHGQLDPRIAADPRVTEMSGTNIRDVTPADLPYTPQVIVSDVSFISLTYVIPPIARLAAPGAHIVLLVKPQFEVGRAHLGKHGIVTDTAAREHALNRVTDCAAAHGLTVIATTVSPIEGTHGNTEYLLYARLGDLTAQENGQSASAGRQE